MSQCIYPMNEMFLHNTPEKNGAKYALRVDAHCFLWLVPCMKMVLTPDLSKRSIVH